MPNLLQIRVRWLSWSHMVEIPFPKVLSMSQLPLHSILAKSKLKALMKVSTLTQQLNQSILQPEP